MASFPSVAAGWVLSEESFLSDVEAVNLLKLRASWGINGNDQIPGFQYQDRFRLLPKRNWFIN